MSKLDEIETAIDSLSRSEKAQLLQHLVHDMDDAFPGIESRPEVCGGEPCIVRTRIPVWVLEQARRLGSSEADLLRSYSNLRAQDLNNAWAFVRAHPDLIERQIRENDENRRYCSTGGAWISSESGSWLIGYAPSNVNVPKYCG